jgi:hypothetical protein
MQSDYSTLKRGGGAFSKNFIKGKFSAIDSTDGFGFAGLRRVAA